ncbi:hypothetical protein CPJCM30710_20010 [Clostridium polyendosporum]|uniref:DUF2508 domain-containing protein n=1 Tax=Clostridium polyendosporum TaxID=69208 RepID=A0A919S1A9_9CLOT|nr:DUF2508 family protein [Clostridium polyendosporum]GIM29335.1 hypothetical protein CPJCM30710_20010 [Clostridium polyendosporum]
MNKKFIIEYVMNRIDDSKEKQDLLNQIEEARIQLNEIREIFDYVSDPKLIEFAIYSEQAARTRYEYLLTEARKKGIKIGYEYIFLNQCK